MAVTTAATLAGTREPPPRWLRIAGRYV